MPMRLLLFAIVAAGNALTLNRIQSVVKLLRCGDFEHLARSFDDDALVLHLPHNQRVVCIHEERVDLAKQACGAKCLADRVGGGAAAPGLTRQRDGDAWRTARARANEALAGAAATRRLLAAAGGGGWDAVDVFVRRYARDDGRRGLGFHADGATRTCNVALSDDDPGGGGRLLVVAGGAVAALPRRAGDATLHDSTLLHAVTAVRPGAARYSLILFFFRRAPR